jgi:hypothetical protein
MPEEISKETLGSMLVPSLWTGGSGGWSCQRRTRRAVGDVQAGSYAFPTATSRQRLPQQRLDVRASVGLARRRSPGTPILMVVPTDEGHLAHEVAPATGTHRSDYAPRRGGCRDTRRRASTVWPHVARCHRRRVGASHNDQMGPAPGRVYVSGLDPGMVALLPGPYRTVETRTAPSRTSR